MVNIEAGSDEPAAWCENMPPGLLGIARYRPALSFLVPRPGAPAGRSVGRIRCAGPYGDMPH
eukprot:scaffold97269_cov35-Phaeocystis_antarctica.AAC.1